MPAPLASLLHYLKQDRQFDRATEDLELNKMNAAKISTLVVTLLMAAAMSAHGATLSQAFRNDFLSNQIWLWADDPVNVDFTGHSFDTPTLADWVATLDDGDRLFMGSSSNTPVAPLAGTFTVDFDYSTPTFRFQWAEIFFDGRSNNLLGSGTAMWNGRRWTGSNRFTHLAEVIAPVPAAVPLPSSIMLLTSSVIFMSVGRLRNTGKA